ncbi:MAG: hypothetical protein OEV01_06360 [Nitrospira sp.]|nr:hypothetical protein [Nitrospira sp.]MDH4303341.1 hypothetical protein [Nitrospira sp.]MDH5194112.1 hypothetical protein [Nitrospira sp.]
MRLEQFHEITDKPGIGRWYGEQDHIRSDIRHNSAQILAAPYNRHAMNAASYFS